MKCEDFELKILEYIDGDLSGDESEKMLEHVSQCRKCAALLVEYKDQDELLKKYYEVSSQPLHSVEKPELGTNKRIKVSNRKITSFYAIAASFALIMVISFSLIIFNSNVINEQGKLIGVADNVMGKVHYFDGNKLEPLREGMKIHSGEKLKTTKNSYLSVKLDTAKEKENFIEFRDNTVGEFVAYNNQTVFSLERGEVWVHLNKENKIPFAVKTHQLLINDIGTVFNVAQGLSGASVGVATGTVEFDYMGAEKKMGAGEYFATITGNKSNTLKEHTTWSHERENLLAMLPPDEEEIIQVSKQLHVPVASNSAVYTATETENQSTLDPVQFLPVDTRFFLIMENPEGIISDWLSSDYGQLFSDPAIKNWWESDEIQEIRDKCTFEFGFEDWVDLVKAIKGSITMGINSNEIPVFIADCRDCEPEVNDIFHNRIEPLIKRWKTKTIGGVFPHISLKRGYLVLTLDSKIMDEILLSIEDNQPSGFTSTEIYQEYRDNVPTNRMGFAYDFASTIDEIKTNGNAELNSFLDHTGFGGLDYIVGSPDFSGRGINHAVRVAFNGPRTGMMRWIDEPLPMGSLRYFAPDVHILAAARIKRPEEMFADLMKWVWSDQSRIPSEQELEEMDTFKEFASCFGNEVAVGLQNPVLPIPNVQVAIEIIDVERFDKFVWSLVEEANNNPNTPIIIEVNDYRNFPIVTISSKGLKFDLSYVILEDFLVTGPGEAFLRHAIDVFEEKNSIVDQYSFKSLLPDTNQMNFSMIVYQDLSRCLSQVGNTFYALNFSEEEKELLPDFSSIEKYSAPGIGYMISNDQYVDFYINGSMGVDFNMGGAMPFVANLIMPKVFDQSLESKIKAANNRLDMTVAALKAYRNDNMKYPPYLDALVSPVSYLGVVPVDPLSENGTDSLKYIPINNQDGYMIYSVGPDGVDDKGLVNYYENNGLRSTGDIVRR